MAFHICQRQNTTRNNKSISSFEQRYTNASIQKSYKKKKVVQERVAHTSRQQNNMGWANVNFENATNYLTTRCHLFKASLTQFVVVICFPIKFYSRLRILEFWHFIEGNAGLRRFVLSYFERKQSPFLAFQLVAMVLISPELLTSDIAHSTGLIQRFLVCFSTVDAMSQFQSAI